MLQNISDSMVQFLMWRLFFFCLFLKKDQLYWFYNTFILRSNSGFEKGILIGDIRLIQYLSQVVVFLRWRGGQGLSGHLSLFSSTCILFITLMEISQCHQCAAQIQQKLSSALDQSFIWLPFSCLLAFSSQQFQI